MNLKEMIRHDAGLENLDEMAVEAPAKLMKINKEIDSQGANVPTSIIGRLDAIGEETKGVSENSFKVRLDRQNFFNAAKAIAYLKSKVKKNTAKVASGAGNRLEGGKHSGAMAKTKAIT